MKLCFLCGLVIVIVNCCWCLSANGFKYTSWSCCGVMVSGGVELIFLCNLLFCNVYRLYDMRGVFLMILIMVICTRDVGAWVILNGEIFLQFCEIHQERRV